MFPFHPKPPTLGKKLVSELRNKLIDDLKNNPSAKGSTSSSWGKTDCKTYQLRNGGPVQRAIRDDILSLKDAFQSDLEHYCGELSRNSSAAGALPLHHHLALGSSFSIYKETFRKKKFGVIHSPELCPPRCDRESFIQMVYSAALEFLYEEDIFELENEPLEGSHDDLRIQMPYSIVFAVFTIYTMYHTNPLPIMPTKEYTTKEDILSTLTMGLASDTVKYKMYRRAYKSPIRLSQDLYAILYQVRNIALLCIDQCQQNNYNERENDSGRVWSCSCSLARDCLHIIDKLEREESFQLCEYTGPNSLEGLAGSKEYYHEIVLKEKDATTMRRNYRENFSDSFPYDDINNSNDISTLIGTKNNDKFDEYDSVLENIAQKLNKNIASSKPLRLMKEVRSNLEPVLKKRRDRRQLKHAIEIIHECDDDYDEEQNYSKTNHSSTKDSAPQNEANQSIDDRSLGKTLCKYASHFPDGLKRGIDLALKDLEKDNPIESSSLLRYPIESRTAKDFDDWFLEGLYGESIENIEPDFMDEHIMDESSIISGEDQTEGIGLLYLQHLLNAAKNKRVLKKATTSRKRTPRRQTHRKEESENVSVDDDDNDDDNDDDDSFSSASARTSGVAGEMFQSLFNAINHARSNDDSSDPDEDEHNRSSTTFEKSRTPSKRAKSIRKQPRSHRRKLDNDMEVSLARNDDEASSNVMKNLSSDEETAGLGANALNDLLSKIC